MGIAGREEGRVRPNGGVSTRPSAWKRRAPAGPSGRNRRIQVKPSSGRRPKAGPRCHAGPSGERATYGWKRTGVRPWAFGRKCIEWGAFSNSLRSSMGRKSGSRPVSVWVPFGPTIPRFICLMRESLTVETRRGQALLGWPCLLNGEGFSLRRPPYG